MNRMVIFTASPVIHAADQTLRPLCHQTDAAKAVRTQQVVADEPTCKRCLAHLERQRRRRESSPLRVLAAPDHVQIWYEDFMCLGSGPTLETAKLAVSSTCLEIIREMLTLQSVEG